jgi:hypothetical protein
MKDPAFLFYSSDFLTGTYLMSDEQVGKYIRLMCYQHQKGRIKAKEFNKIAEGDEDLIEKFTRDEQGNFYNPRLEEETVKRTKYCESRRKNFKSKSSHMETHMETHMESHMENENENEDVNRNVSTTPRAKKCLMKNSGLTLEQVKEAFERTDDLKTANYKYYFQAAMDWSDSKGEMRKDWLATIRTFARRDLADGKLKIKSSVTASRTNAAPPVPKDYGKPSKTATPMPDSLRKRFNNIGNE